MKVLSVLGAVVGTGGWRDATPPYEDWKAARGRSSVVQPSAASRNGSSGDALSCADAALS